MGSRANDDEPERPRSNGVREEVPRSIAFYKKLGFVEGNSHTTHPFYAPRGEFRVVDPDGYVLMVTHT